MNAAQITNIIPQAEEVESTTFEESEVSRRAATRVTRDAGVRRLLLFCIVLLLGALTFVTISSIRQIEAEFDMIHANLVSSPQSPSQTQSHILLSGSARSEHQ